MNKGLFRENIITSIIDTDAYKIHMMQAVFELFPNKLVEYDFKCRSKENLYDLFVPIRDEIYKLESLQLSFDQLTYFQKIPFIKESFLDSLRNFRFDPKRHVFMGKDEEGQLEIKVKGTWYQVILYEIFILAIVSEVRNRHRWSEIKDDDFRKVLHQKIRYLKSEVKRRGLEGYFKFADFGTRRRFSYKTQFDVVDALVRNVPEMFFGTSNYHIAKELNLTPIGTMAHEYLCAHQAIVHPKKSVVEALNNWNKVFGGSLGIALTDAITTDTFIKDFDLGLAKLFDGVRHDSGCPYVWGDKFIAHYEKLGIDPMTKTLVFSDGLNFEKALDIAEYFKGRINFSFGIGTFLSNDMGDFTNSKGEKYKPLNIVMKLMVFDGIYVAKISDEPAKAMSRSKHYLNYLLELFEIEDYKLAA